MQSVLLKWHQFVETRNSDILDEILDEQVVFHSPVVWTPQEGKVMTKLYLTAALFVFEGGDSDFTYVREVVTDQHLILEFMVTLEGITINGVDMIEINEAGKIINFKVMVRPLKAMQKIHEKMGEMLKGVNKK